MESKLDQLLLRNNMYNPQNTIYRRTVIFEQKGLLEITE